MLLDVSMPGLDGVEVLRRLRARRGGGPAVIMLTAARREPHAIEAGLKEGADAYLTKPIDSRELLARVRAALETFRLKRMLEAQRRDHIAMLVHDLRHPLSSLGLIAEVLDSEDLTADERAADGRADPRHVHGDGAPGRRRARRQPARGGRLHGRAADDHGAARHRARCSRSSRRSPRAAGWRSSFDGSLDLEVRADPQKLRQALDNLVANALKFTPRGGRVASACGARRRPQTVFEIADTGPGVARGGAGHDLRPVQAGSRGRAAGGAGLGLAIARGIAEAHQGTIDVTTGDLGGAAFRIVLPAEGRERRLRPRGWPRLTIPALP